MSYNYLPEAEHFSNIIGNVFYMQEIDYFVLYGMGQIGTVLKKV